MKFETLSTDERIPKIGFGTWKIGGESWANRTRDAQAVAALRSAIELGYTHFDTSEMYGAGHAEELLGRAIRESGVPRESLFITTKVWPDHLRYNDVLHACRGSLHRLGIETIDLYLIHWPNPMISLKDSFRALNELVAEGEVRHLGVSNFGLAQLYEAQSLSDTPILTDQGPYSLVDRTYERNGVLEYCQDNDILFTAYSPVDQGNLKVSEALQTVAAAHGATPHQIALAWLIQQPKVITIPMSRNPQHQAENLAAAEIVLTPAELDRLNSAR